MTKEDDSKALDDSAFDVAFASLGVEIGKLAHRASRQRTVLTVTVISLIFDIILSLVVYRIAVKGKEIAQDVASAKHATVLICQAGNQSRSQQADGWDSLIALSNQIGPVKALTPEEQARQDKLLVGFQTYLKGLRTPRDCSHLTSPTTTTTSNTTTSNTTTLGQ